jgi:YbaB/EbfC DNA-binding family
MTAVFDEELDRLLQEYRAARARAGELQRQMREISASAVAPRQTVKVTVGVQGELTGLEFPTGGYRRMAPNELAEAILGAAREAGAKARQALAELAVPRLPGGVEFADLVRGTADLSRMLPEEPPMLDLVRDYVDGDRAAMHPPGAVNG